MNLSIARKNLESPNTESVITALRVFGRKGKLIHLQLVLPLIKNNSPEIRKESVDSAASLIRENLVSHFHELEPEIRKKLGTKLQTLDPLVIDSLSEDLYCEDETRRLRSVQILGLLKKNPKLKDVLAKLIKDRNEKIRATAVNLLGKVVGPNDQDIIMALMHDHDKRVRANTVEALESMGNKRLVPILLRFRKDPNNRIRGNVLRALYTLEFREITGDLQEMLGSANEFMQASALWVIAQTGIASTTIENLAAHFLMSRNGMVQTNARKALKQLSTPRAKSFLKFLTFDTLADPIPSPSPTP